MGKRHKPGPLIVTAGALLLLALTLLTTASAGTTRQSAFSRWLSDVATPQIREQLAAHPRFAGAPVQLQAAEKNGLVDAVLTVLTRNLQGRQGITLAGAAPAVTAAPGGSIDALSCAPAIAPLRLRIAASESGQRRGRVELTLVDDSGALPQRWEWRGSFTRHELRVVRESRQSAVADGSLLAPWGSSDVELAALSLHRQLACALRPQLRTRLDLDWPAAQNLVPLFADTVHRSRHLLGDYLELGLLSSPASAADFKIRTELTPFSNNVWQLWLKAEPQKTGLAPVQAAAYFQGPRTVVASRSEVPALPVTALPASTRDRGPALDYLAVEMLDARQAERGRGEAQLLVEVRLENSADWPIEYAFRLSGGHYQHCIAEPHLYRHDGYGRVKGRLKPGESLVRQLVINRAQHRPNPFMGTRKCAGFRSLEGFEDYATRGYTVTEYVRWGG